MENSSQSAESFSEEPSSEILLWAEYPGGQFQAVVQSDGQSIYFAIQSAEERFGPPRWTWVRNLCSAPLNFSKKSEDAFRPALLPSSYCSHPSGEKPLQLEKTQIVWMEQGIGAALVENGEVLAVIPPLLGQNLPGYARDCIHQSQIALPLDADDEYQFQVPSCQAYWNSWADPEAASRVYDGLARPFVESFGPAKGQFRSEDQNRWPQVSISKYEWKDTLILATTGVSVRKQPQVESQLQNFEDHQRMELVMTLSSDCSESFVELSLNRLITMARYPWFIQTHFLPMQTFQWQPPLDQGTNTAAFWPDSLIAEKQSRSPLTMPSYFNLPVNLLWVCPHDPSEKPNADKINVMWKE